MVDLEFEPNSGADYPVLSVAPAVNGKVIMGGYFTHIGGVLRPYMARLNAHGTLDRTFDPGSGPNSRVVCVLPQSDGKTLISGLFTSFNGTNRGHIARLEADGNLDPSFDPGSGANADVLCLFLQADGKVLLAGDFTMFNGIPCGRVARLHSDGRLDTAFNTSEEANLAVRSIVAVPGGKVLIGGDFVSVQGTNQNRIARLNADGRLDSSFNIGQGANGTVETLSTQSDGSIIVGGQFSSINGTNRGRLARLSKDGLLDATFNPNADGFVLSASVHRDDKIMLGGDFFTIGGMSRPHVARLNGNGNVDQSFVPGVGANDTVNAVAFQPDGKPLAGGFFNTMNGVGRSGLVRLEGDPLPPSLQIRLTGRVVVISWPTSFTNFALQTATNAGPPGVWANVGRRPP